MSGKKGKFQPAGIGMVPSRTELGSFIRARRLELDLRQVPLAKQAKVAPSLITMIEVGVRRYLKDQQLERLAKTLQCDVEELRKRMPVKRIAQPKTELGKLIRSRREELGLSLPAFAKKMGMTPQQAKHLEVKKNPGICYGLSKPLASALELDPSVIAQFAGNIRKQTNSKLGQLIRARRKELGMSLNVLAEKLNVSRQFVNQIEFGQNCLSESDERIEQLAQVLEVDVNELQAVRPLRRQKQMDRTPLGEFLATKRLELRLTQREVGKRAGIQYSTVSCVETGRFYPSPNLLVRLAKALRCEIPAELVPELRSRGRPRNRTAQDALASSALLVRFSGQDSSGLIKIKELSDIRTSSEAVRKALKLLQHLLEKQSDGYVVCLRKDKDVMELELLL